MVKLKCKRCGNGFSVKEYDEKRRMYCGSDSCDREGKRIAMRVYRETDRGKAMVKIQNLRYKRAEIEYECYICKDKFMSNRKRNTCHKCLESINMQGVKNPQLVVNMRKWRKNNPSKVKAHWSINSLYREDRSYNKDRKRPVCLVCNEKKTEAHHHNYSQPLDVTFLCKPHHVELHSWDAV